MQTKQSLWMHRGRSVSVLIQDAADGGPICKQDHLVAYGLASWLFNATLATKEVEGEEQEMLHRLKVLFLALWDTQVYEP